jgi:hypothetical protein
MVFKEDVTALTKGKQIELSDPFTGEHQKFKLPPIHYVISNLPFVQQEDIEALNPGIKGINNYLSQISQGREELSGKSDLYAYLIFYLGILVEADGIITVNISNSWLSSKWGDTFKKLILRVFKIEYVLTSGKGKWFKEPKVITNIVVLRKRNASYTDFFEVENETVLFITLNKKIEEISSHGVVGSLPSLIRKCKDGNYDGFTKISHSVSTIQKLESLGLSWNAFFSDCNWLLEISDKLIEASTFFEINRGSRRGWDDMFYPIGNHGIEPVFIKPVLKSSSTIEYLDATPDGEAFSCNMTEKELKENKYFGALNWIKKFEGRSNKKGILLPLVLKKSGNENWYVMSTNELADIVTSINPGDRLFFARLVERSFVNQRLIRFTIKNDSMNLDILQALMNSIVSLFYLEAIGFGRGMGALDLNSENVKTKLHFLNPKLLDSSKKEEILCMFKKIKERKIKPIREELKSEDRLQFEDVVFKSYGITQYKDEVIKSLLAINSIRTAVAS